MTYQSDIPEVQQYKDNFSILVADDSQLAREVLSERLHEDGYFHIETAQDGLEALQKIKSKKIDLILLDISMPKLDGIGVMRALKDDIVYDRIMVLVLSEAKDSDNIIECLKLGAEDFIPKPFDNDLLRVRVQSCVEKRWYKDRETRYQVALEKEMHTYQNLLRVILPEPIIEELTQNSLVKPRVYNNVAVVFADVANFTPFCRVHSAEEIFDALQAYMEVCENLAKKYGLEKIKSIGDAFMATAGLLDPDEIPVNHCVEFSQHLFAEVKKLPAKWSVHIGIDYGSVIGGIVGKDKYLFEIWGDVVNTASRLQELAKPDTICLSKEAWTATNNKFPGEPLGKIDIKGKGLMEIYVIKANK